jgi:hypothetical protein
MPQTISLVSRDEALQNTAHLFISATPSYGLKWNADFEVRILAAHVGSSHHGEIAKQKGSGTILQLWNRTGALS